MSLFSGKCDLYDSLIMIRKENDDTDWTKYEIEKYTKDSHLNTETFKFEGLEKITVTCVKDLVPYFPFIECIGISSADHSHIILSEKSFIDSEEEEFMFTKVNSIKRYVNHCKRNGETPEFNDFCKKHWWNDSDTNLETIFERIVEHPYKKDRRWYIKDLHDSMHNYYRKMLYEEMIKYGYSEDESYKWVYEGVKTWN